MRDKCEARVTEEPGAGKPHAGICAGGAGDRHSYRDRRQPLVHVDDDSPWIQVDDDSPWVHVGVVTK